MRVWGGSSWGLRVSLDWRLGCGRGRRGGVRVRELGLDIDGIGVPAAEGSLDPKVSARGGIHAGRESVLGLARRGF